MRTQFSQEHDARVSEHIPNPLEVELAVAIRDVDALSFDFFDTLCFRAVLEPEVVFDILGERFGILGFREIRRAAQAEAFKQMHAAGKKEITLHGIYDCMQAQSVSTRELMRAEMEIELSVLCPNQELIEIFFAAVREGKKVVLTSDMYLPQEFFEAAFRTYDLPIVPFFISSECNATKRDSGELYDIVVEALGLPRAKVLHIGDNPHGDVKQAQMKGLSAFHYLEYRRPVANTSCSTEISIARALVRRHSGLIRTNSFEELGYLYGGPAAVGYLDWIIEQAERDNIDHVLFMSRDGFILEKIGNAEKNVRLPKFDYFYGSRIAFTLAAIDDSNFVEHLPFLLSGADGLSTYELLERIGVAAPSDRVLTELGLGNVFRYQDKEKVETFFCAYRHEILKVCRRNRRALYSYLLELKIVPGSRVALVDVGWNGTSQETFELAIANLINIDVFGYYLCLTDRPECNARKRKYRMSAMFSTKSASQELIAQIYTNRMVAELFFSAPHQTVIGWEMATDGTVRAIEDARSNTSTQLSQINAAIAEGMFIFAQGFIKLRSNIQLPTVPQNLAMSLIEFMIADEWKTNELMKQVKDFDAWAFTENQKVLIVESDVLKEGR